MWIFPTLSTWQTNFQYGRNHFDNQTWLWLDIQLHYLSYSTVIKLVTVKRKYYQDKNNHTNCNVTKKSSEIPHFYLFPPVPVFSLYKQIKFTLPQVLYIHWEYFGSELEKSMGFGILNGSEMNPRKIHELLQAMVKI